MAIPKPLPDPDDPDYAPFWQHAARSELAILRCSFCGVKRWPPRPACARCHSTAKDWVSVRGVGTIYSWTTIGRPMHPGFAQDVPYVVVIVELDDEPGIRLLGNLLDSSGEDLGIGLPVEVEFVAGEMTLPQWRLRA